MLTKENQVEIKVLHRQGKGIREISRQTGIARNTVRRILREIAREKYRRSAQPSILDPFKAYLQQRLEQAGNVRLHATVLHREIAQHGYVGSVSVIKRYLRTIRPEKVIDPVVRFETAPGHQLQIDFVDFRRGEMPLRAFTAELGYSRYPYVEFVDNERTETLISCLERALEYFGGVPNQVLCDNPKTIVIERHAYGEGKHRFNPKLLDFAKHYGVSVKLCAPYRAQTKGKVERFHRYLRESFFNPLQTQQTTPVSIEQANREVRIWLREVAVERIHATLRERPIDRFAQEQKTLRALPLPYGVNSHWVKTVSVGPIPIESLQHPLSVYEHAAKEFAP